MSHMVLCRKCGSPLLSEGILRRFSGIAQEKGLKVSPGTLELCPGCRAQAFAQDLLGDEIAGTRKVKPPARRRTSEVNPVRPDPRTGCTVYKSQCYICNSGCDAVAYVKNGMVVKVEGDPSSPVTKGTLCAKGLASKHMLYHPERLRHPLKRAGKRGEDRWQRISWDEALDSIVESFRAIQEKYGKDSIALATGTSRGWVTYFRRFANALGCQSIAPGVAQCYLPRMTGGILVTGGPAMECPDYTSTNCMLVWGTNPAATWPIKALGMMEAKARGAGLIVVDPVLSETASKADIWLQLRPGTDAALALGMINVVCTEGLYDSEFVDRWCVGFTELRERVQQFSPEKTEEITWVPKDRLVEAARAYATNRPASITQVLSIDQNADTISSSRALAMLAAITGNIDRPGGNLFPMRVGLPPEREITLNSRLTKEQHAKRLGSKEYPFLSGEPCVLSPVAHNAIFWKAVLTGVPYPVRALYCHGDNIAVAYGNAALVEKALLSLDFFVVADLFMTPTARLADLVLPAATWLERNAVSAHFQTSCNNIHLQQKVVEVEECWTDYRILNELGKRLGICPPMFESDEAFCDYLLKSTGITFEEFRKKGIVSVPYAYRKYEKNGFATPSGKIELYSRKLKDLGFDPLPDYIEPSESPVSTPGLAKEYPLIITTGGRAAVFRHSELRNIPVLREIEPDLRAVINPTTAAALGIEDGDTVVVESPRGAIEAKAHLNMGIDARVVQVPSHWAGKNNVNLLMDIENCAPMVGSTQLRCQLCRVRRAGRDA